MFTQVYFHKTRVAYDIHLRGALKELLPSGVFPKPTTSELLEYLKWDDWRVLGLLTDGRGGEHGLRLTTRNHFRNIFSTPEVSKLSDMDELKLVKEKLGTLVAAEEPASKSWYKTGTPDIRVVSATKGPLPLSKYSSVLANLKANNQVLLYVRPEHADDARKKLSEVLKKDEQSD
jgi:HD superfamily phosphohydrolase